MERDTQTPEDIKLPPPLELTVRESNCDAPALAITFAAVMIGFAVTGVLHNEESSPESPAVEACPN